jgi:hypothetical protein
VLELPIVPGGIGVAGVDPHAYLLRAAAIQQPGAVTYFEDLLNAN